MTSNNRTVDRTDTDDRDLIHLLEVFIDDGAWGKNASFRVPTPEHGTVLLKRGAAVLWDLNQRELLEPITDAIANIDVDEYDPGQIGEVHVYSDDTFELDL